MGCDGGGGGGLAAAYGESELALGNYRFARLPVTMLRSRGVRLEFELLGGAGFEVDALEAAQGFDGGSGDFGEGEVELCDFVAGDLAGVSDF